MELKVFTLSPMVKISMTYLSTASTVWMVITICWNLHHDDSKALKTNGPDLSSDKDIYEREAWQRQGQ